MLWIVVIGILILLVCWFALIAFNYYAAVLGLLYYTATQHDDALDAEKVKELRDYALRRRISELLKKH